MKITSTRNPKHLPYIQNLCAKALVETADALSSDLKQSQTMPFNTGNLQDRSTSVDDSKKNRGKVSIVSDTPYARKLYFHPEYKFKRDKNPNAGGMWFQPYIDGKKKNFAKMTFAKLLKGKLK